MPKLLRNTEEGLYTKQTDLVEEPERLKGLMNSTAWDIMRALAEKPRYPAEIAEELGIHEQKVYYHVRKLKENNLIKILSTEGRRGSTVKYYTPTSRAFALELPGEETPADINLGDRDENMERFLNPLVANGKIDCRVVVGSPDPHGPHQVRGRDGHFAVDLAAALGRYGRTDSEITSLDVDVKNENAYDSNLILVGGYLTNTITSEFNSYMPVRFEQEKFPYRRLISDQTGEVYSDDSMGVVTKIRNPKSQDHFAIVLAGVRSTGTKAAVLSLTRFHEKVFEDYESEENWARVVRGRDMDGDGKIDDIEVVE
ncbi:MAG: helix-turn-helix domain-containing protein [Candidatus Nanohaloarchaea archaeon]|nr:helix-turn-helix domain-containing protein [Candidatus Nanohaloarchaea archaeon]